MEGADPNSVADRLSTESFRTHRVRVISARDLNRKERVTVVMVTHDLAAAASGDRTVEISDGRIVREFSVAAEAGGRA